MTEDEADDMQHMLRYTVRILIKHPSIDPARITSVLGLEPTYTAITGGVRKTPTGIILSGVHKVSGWGHSYDVGGKRPFFSDVEKYWTNWNLIKPFWLRYPTAAAPLN